MSESANSPPVWPGEREPPSERGAGGRSSTLRGLRSPLLLLTVYYLVVIVLGAFLIREFPLVQRALVTPDVPAIAEGAALATGEVPTPRNIPPATSLPAQERAVTTLLVVIAAILLAIPVAVVYMLTKRLRFDPGLVRSMVLLPIAVAGILMVVKNSLAIAFSLAGIVAAVRFRNTLKDPRDAVYIFLTIAIGIAAGVQALDVALVVSLVFNVVVFLLWKFRVGSLQAGLYGRTGVLSLGDPALLVAQTAAACDAVRSLVLKQTKGLKPDGILLVHSAEPEVTRHGTLEALRQNADDWRVLEPIRRGDGLTTARYVLELNKKSDPASLLGALDEWFPRIAAAEFVPFHRRRSKRKKEEEDDDDDD